MAVQKMPIGRFVAELEAALNRKDGYIMGATGQNPKNWSVNSWWFTQYSGSQKTKALYWRENASFVWDCNGMAEGIYKKFTGVDINTQAKYNYSGWCNPKGSGTIPAQYRVPGAAVFWGNGASNIHHVAYLYKPVTAGNTAGDWYIIEARGVMYGVVKTKLSERKPNFWGWMTKYFDYNNVDIPAPATYKFGERVLKKGMIGDDVKELQAALNKLGYNCGTADGDFGTKTEDVLKNFQKTHDCSVDGVYGPASHKAMIAALNAPAATGDFVTIIGSSVNIRKGPGTSYGILKAARSGDKFERVDAAGWVCVKYNDNICWASAKYVNGNVCTATALNVRKGPGANYASVGTVKNGYKFASINTDGWVPILINGVIYWVSGKYAE